MHMSDALISPVVGGVMLAVTAGLSAYSVRKIQQESDLRKIPLMGVMGAFVFAAQMINFSIPGTGSSGHIGGGLLLAVMLGPGGGFVALASILLIQALFFADGGLLALGCNAFNLGFFTNYLAYPLIFLPILSRGWTTRRIWIASVLAAVAGLQLGAFSVVVQTVLSGKTELPFTAFVLLMQPIHLAVGIVEGIVTAAVLSFVWKARPEIFDNPGTTRLLPDLHEHESGTPRGSTVSQPAKRRSRSMRSLLAWLLAVALIIGGVLSWYASADPDGLEWSIQKITGEADLETDSAFHRTLNALRERLAFLPDYAPRDPSNPDNPLGQEPVAAPGEPGEPVAAPGKPGEPSVPSPDPGTSLAGVAGGLMVLALVALIALLAVLLKKKRQSITPTEKRPVS